MHKALDALTQVDISKEKLNETSATIGKYFDQAVRIIIASKDFIASAVSAKPYAAVAWTGISFLLPVSYFEALFHVAKAREASP